MSDYTGGEDGYSPLMGASRNFVDVNTLARHENPNYEGTPTQFFDDQGNLKAILADLVGSGQHPVDPYSYNPVLKEGEKVNLTLKGYCSPLASTSYNVNLAKRRLSSLVNYFNAYQDGALKNYLADENKVKIIIEEVGELKASQLVSDNPNDATNAVYSRAAALERKIQIIAISTKD